MEFVVNILNVEKVTKGFGDRVLFDNITLGINKGDKIGIVGVNGTGKSTLLKIIAGLEEPDEGKVVKGANVTVAYLCQTPAFEDNENIIDYVVKGVRNSNTSKETVISSAKNILNKLGITDFEMDIMNMSGGQKKRVALAQTLIEPAEILILDEPTNHLDNDMVIWLEQFIKKFKGQLIMVTHDRYFLDNVTNRIVELDKGNLYSYDTNYSGYLTLKTEREDIEQATERKRTNILRTELQWIMRGCQARSTKQQARIDRFEDMKAKSREARAGFEKQNLEMSSIGTRLGKKTVEAVNITKAFDSKILIKDFNYIFLRDDRIGIIGPNGCGKSTLIKIITGNLAPDSGYMDIGETVRIGAFMQDNVIEDENINVLEFVKNIGEYVTTADGKITASQMCEKFLFTPKMQWTPILKLSGGEKRRLYLLSVLMSSPNVLILDEPTNDLDIETLEILEDYLDRFTGIIITVSHDRYFLDRIVDRIFAFEGNGKLQQYEGGFTDYYEKTHSIDGVSSIYNSNAVSTSNTANSAKEKYCKDRSTKLKFSYMEQKEYETIDEDIAALENKIEELDAKIAESATQYSKLNDLMEEKNMTEAQLSDKMDRWVYLNDLAEKIANQQ